MKRAKSEKTAISKENERKKNATETQEKCVLFNQKWKNATNKLFKERETNTHTTHSVRRTGLSEESRVNILHERDMWPIMLYAYDILLMLKLMR